jgi:serine/threonine protein kinase
LVSEFVENGSLDKALFVSDGGGESVLAWRSLYKIAAGVAKGLAYLHHECLEWIVHCDVKPENILLDAELDPKITDFGLVKLLSRDACGRLVMSSRAQCTTRGYTYTAPEWTAGLPITGKADVYSFGVVLLELLRGQRVCDWELLREREEEEVCSMDFRRLVAWIREKTTERDEELSSFAWLEEFIDRRLHGDFSRLQAAAMLELAVSCVDDDPVRRPNMNAVLQKLLSLEDAASMRYA